MRKKRIYKEGQNVKVEEHKFRMQIFKDQYIRYLKGDRSAERVYMDRYYGDWESIFQRHLDEGLIPIMVTATFNNLPDGPEGQRVAERIIEEHYRKTLLPTLVDKRRSDKFPDRHPRLYLFPEFGDGEENPHFHGVMFIDKKTCHKVEEREFGWTFLFEDIDNRFKGLGPHGQDFHLQRIINRNEVMYVLSYALKKYAFLPMYFRNGSTNDFIMLPL